MEETWSVAEPAARELVTNTLTLVLTKHTGQTRKDGETPYVVHLLRVADLLRENGASVEVVCAGLAHDLIEDTKCSWDTLAEATSPAVADLVAAVSEDKRQPRAVRKAAYLDGLEEQPAAVQMIKLADWLDNTLDLDTTPWSHTQRRAYLDRAEGVWERTAGANKTLRARLRAAIDEQRGKL